MDDKELKQLLEEIGPSENVSQEELDKLFERPEKQVVAEHEQVTAERAAEILQTQHAATEHRKAQLRAELEARDRMGETNFKRAAASRQRAARGNMKRRLRSHFQYYEAFTPDDAAVRCGVPLAGMTAYLEKEVLMPGTDLLSLDAGRYCLANPFD